MLFCRAGWRLPLQVFRTPARLLPSTIARLKTVGDTYRAWDPVRSGGGRCFATRVEDQRIGGVEVPQICPGCGIRLQQSHPDKPGYVRIPERSRFGEKAMDLDELEEDDSYSAESMREETDLIHRHGAELTNELIGSEIIEEDRSQLRTEKERVLVCERCFSLQNYGKPKNDVAETLVPKFSIENALKPKIAKTAGKKVVIVCVVDLFDFDGSLPLKELQSLFEDRSELPDFLEFIFVGNKSDLLYKTLSQHALDVWVRTQLKACRFPFGKSVYIMSSHTMFGVRDLMIGLRKKIGRNADCYIIGTQNAGKSSMLNALTHLTKKERDIGHTTSRTEKPSLVTTAALPGTTLGFVEVFGFPVTKSCRVFDTPGIEHTSQITHRLTVQELKLVQPKKMVKPRTYRFGPDNSLLIGGLVRLDLNSSPGRTVYITVWVSEEMKHRGHTLKPPISDDPELESAGPLLPRAVKITGNSWKQSSVDICIAGLGWVAVGCSGESEFTVWTLKGIQVTKRASVLKDYAPNFQKPGFSDSVTSRGLPGKR